VPTIEQATQQTVAALDSLGLSHVVVVAHSFGAHRLRLRPSCEHMSSWHSAGQCSSLRSMAEAINA